MRTRTKERAQFLSDVLVTAVEHAGYGFPGIVEYKCEPDDDPSKSFAVIYDRYEETEPMDRDEEWKPEKTWRIDIETMAKGLGIVRKLPARPEGAAEWVKDVIAADRSNGDDGDVDVVGALLVLECALFGRQVYA